MDKQHILQSLKSLLETRILEGEAIQLDATTPLLGLGVLDSFALMQLASLIESEFRVEIPLESLQLDHLKDLNSMADLVLDLNRSGP